MQNKNEIITDNHTSVIKVIRQKKKGLKEKVGIIDGGRGLPYVNIYTLLYQLVNERTISSSEKIVIVAEYIVFLNPDINLDNLQRWLEYFASENLNISIQQLDLSFLPTILANKHLIKVEPNDMQRYAPGRLKNSASQNFREIVNYRIERSNSEYAEIKASFHGLIDSHLSNWANICPKIFSKFESELLEKYFDSIFSTIYNQRQKSLRAYLKQRNKTVQILAERKSCLAA